MDYLQYFFTGISIGSVYALVALGFSIIYNSSGVFNFAQGEFVSFGGLLMYSLSSVLKLPIPLAFFLSVSIVTLVGAVLERLAIHYPLKRASVIILIIITIGASFFLQGVAKAVWGTNAFSYSGFSGEKPFVFYGAALNPQILWVLGITFLVVSLLTFFFNQTLLGKAIRACAIDKVAASLLGINTKWMIFLSFLLSAMIGGIGGIIITPLTMVSFDKGIIIALKGFAAAVLGGMGSFTGAVLAGFMIGLIEAFGAGLVSSGFKDAMVFLILLFILFVKPEGLFGASK